MKIIRPQDVAIKTNSDFDWDGYVDAFDWGAFYESCSMDKTGYPMTDEEWGTPVFKDGYRLVSLNLPLTSEDIVAIREKCGSSFFNLESARPVFKLIGDMLFVVDDIRGFCWAIVRFEPTANGYLAIELLEDTKELRLQDPISAAAYIADWLSDLLPSSRFDPIDRGYLDKGFCWKEADDPEHEPSAKFFRSGDIAVLSKSKVDWDCLLDSIDWPGLHRICANHYLPEVSNDGGYRFKKDSYRLITLDLVLTKRDMKAIRSVCDDSCSTDSYSRTVFQLVEQLLVMVDVPDGICRTTIIRFEETDAGWRAVELVEDIFKSEAVAPLMAAATIAQLLDGVVRGRRRFGWIDKDDQIQGWYWRDAGNLLEDDA